MTKSDNKNPLFSSQREKSGARTFDKYLYQYNWALYRIISEHDEKSEYAVFIEYHEDVVVCNSLDSGKATFEFNQVKATATKFSTYQLVHKKKNGSSVLGKLIQSVNAKPFADRISELNLISTNDFNLQLETEGVDLRVIRKEDLSKKQLTELEEALKKEIAITELPSSLKFIISELSDSSYHKIIIWGNIKFDQ